MDATFWALLEEIGYRIDVEEWSAGFVKTLYIIRGDLNPQIARHAKATLGEAKAACLAHAESPEGLKANLPTVLRLLGNVAFEDEDEGAGIQAFTLISPGAGTQQWTDWLPSHEAAAWALLKKVRGVA